MLRKANTPQRENWHLQVRMYNFFVFNYRTEVFNGELLDKIDEGSIFLMDKNGN